MTTINTSDNCISVALIGTNLHATSCKNLILIGHGPFSVKDEMNKIIAVKNGKRVFEMSLAAEFFPEESQ